MIICTVFRAGFLGSGRFGSGVIVARRDDGSWSVPSAVGMFGGGFGGLAGVEMTDFVFIVSDENAMKTVLHRGSLHLGVNASAALGPVGRSFEIAGVAGLKGVGGVFAFAKTKGVFLGASLEGAAFIEGRRAGRKLYGRDFDASQLLNEGGSSLSLEVKPLMDVLALDIFHPRRSEAAVDLPTGVVELPAGDESHASELHASSLRETGV